jgi:hypothetical protein
MTITLNRQEMVTVRAAARRRHRSSCGMRPYTKAALPLSAGSLEQRDAVRAHQRRDAGLAPQIMLAT